MSNELFLKPQGDKSVSAVHAAMRAEDTAQSSCRVAVYLLLSPDTVSESDFSHFTEWWNNTSSGDAFVGLYCDDISAPTAPRPNYTRLLSDCKDGKINRILCRSVSDFVPDVSEFVEVLRFLRECQVTIFFEEEALDTAESTTEEILTGLDAFHREEKRGRSEARRQTIKRRGKSGISANRMIYGYRYAEGKGEVAYETAGRYSRRRLVIVEEEARVVRRIFQLAADGVSCGEAARMLNREGIPAPVLNRKRKSRQGTLRESEDRDAGWTAQQIRRMLRQERYAEDAIVSRELFESVQRGGSALRDSDQIPCQSEANEVTRQFEVTEGIRQYEVSRRSEAPHQAGVTRQSETTRQTKVRKKPSPPPFSGKIICGNCGRFFHITNRAVNPIWVCPSARRNNGFEFCAMGTVHEKKLVEALKAALVIRLVSDRSLTELADFLEQSQSLERRERLDFSRRLHQVREEREDCERAIRRLRARLTVERVRDEVLGEADRKEVESTASLAAELARTERDRNALAEQEKDLQAQIQQREVYWQELRKGEADRKRTLEWMRTLCSVEDFEKGLDDQILASLILSVTVCSEDFIVRWLDHTETQIR